MIEDRNAPFSTGGFFLMQLALMVPVVNLVLLLIFAFSGSVNVNLQNYSKAMLLWMLISAVVGAAFVALAIFTAGGVDVWSDGLEQTLRQGGKAVIGNY